MSALDPNFFEKNWSAVRERSWELGQSFRRFESDWKSIQSIWGDSASDYIRDRFISSIEADDASLTCSIHRQLEASELAKKQFFQIRENLTTAHRHSKEDEARASEAYSDLASSRHSTAHAENAMKASHHAIRECESALSAASSHVQPI